MRRGALLFLAGTLLALLASIPDVRAYPTEDRENALTTTVGDVDEKNLSFQDLCHFKICAMNGTGFSPIISEIALTLSAEQDVDEHAKKDAYKDVSMETFEDEEKEFQRVRRASKKKGKENGNDDDSSSSSSSDDDDDNDDHQKSPKRCVKSKKDDDDDDDDCDNNRKSMKQSVKSKNDDNDCDDDDDDDDNDDDDDDNDDDDSSSSSSSSSEENKKRREKRHIEDDSLEDVSSPKREKRRIEDDTSESVSSSEELKNQTRFIRGVSENYSFGEKNNPTNRHVGEVGSKSESSSKKEDKSKESGLIRIPLFRTDGENKQKDRFVRSFQDTSGDIISSFEKTGTLNRFIRGLDTSEESKSSFSKERNEPKNRLVRSTEDSTSKLSSEKSDKALFLIPPYIEDVSRSHNTVKQTDKLHNRVTRSNDGKKKKKKKKIQKKKNTKTKRHCTPKATTPKVDTHETMLPTDHLPV